jgi:hypothetical protein
MTFLPNETYWKEFNPFYERNFYYDNETWSFLDGDKKIKDSFDKKTLENFVNET